MEKIVRQSMLYDFYGELLTEHQKTIYGEYVNNDLSYSEIADLYHITRQGVYDVVKRSDIILEDYEIKLHLVAKFQNARDEFKHIKDIANELKDKNKDSQDLCTGLNRIISISDSILEEF